MSHAMFSWRHSVLQSTLPPTTRLVLLTLSCHMTDTGEGCFPSVAQLVAETGLSRRAVMAHLQSAREAGYIETTRHGFSGQKWARNEYRIKWPDDQKGGAPGAPPCEKGGARNAPPSEKGGAPDAPPSGPVISSRSTSFTPLISPQPPDSDGCAVPSDTAVKTDAAIERTAAWMLGKLRLLNPAHREPNWRRWHREIRLLVDRDGRSPPEIRDLFGWANADPFWQTNILSPGKLRKQWDALVIRRKSAGGAASTEAANYACVHCNGKERGRRMVPGIGWLCQAGIDEHERRLAHV